MSLGETTMVGEEETREYNELDRRYDVDSWAHRAPPPKREAGITKELDDAAKGVE